MARKLIVEIVGDASSLDRAFKKSSRSADRFGRNMEQTASRTRRTFVNLGKGAAVAFGAGAAVGIKTSIQAASDLEQQISKTDVVFGQSAKEVEAWSQNLTRSFGLSQREALTMASTLGALLAPIGLTGRAAAQQAEALTQLGADLASFYNTDVQSAMDALRSGLVGEAEPLRKYGILLSEARVQQEAMAETGKKSATQLTAQEKVLARIALVFKDSSAAQGDFARTGDTLANQIKTFHAETANLEAELGKKLVPALTTVIQFINDMGTALKVTGDKIVDFFSHLPHHAGQWARDIKKARETAGLGEAPAGALGPVGAPLGAPGGARRATGATRSQIRERRARIRQAAEAARQAVLDRAEFNVEKTGATKTLKDDLAALRRYNALLTKRIKGGHGTLELEREQFHVQQQIADVLKQQADLAKRTKKRLGVDVTRFQKSARGQFVLAGAAGGGRGVVISGGVHLHGVQNVGDMENQLARRAKQRAHQRRRRR